MSRVINFDKGSKRRLRMIRWTVFERSSAALLFVILSILCVLVALWDASHSGGHNRVPQLELRH